MVNYNLAEWLYILISIFNIRIHILIRFIIAYSEDEDEGELLFDAIVEQPDNTECITLDQEPGACVTLRRCHPILFADNGDLRNPSLAQDYSQSVDICGREQNTSDDDRATYDADLERAGVDNPVKCM